MSLITTRKINFKIFSPILIIIILGAIYFMYKSFFSYNEVYLDESNNSYIYNTKIGGYIDIINKENLSFNTDLNNSLLYSDQDFTLQIASSTGIGRLNPFTP